MEVDTTAQACLVHADDSLARKAQKSIALTTLEVIGCGCASIQQQSPRTQCHGAYITRYCGERISRFVFSVYALRNGSVR
jgi:hypothetical protein